MPLWANATNFRNLIEYLQTEANLASTKVNPLNNPEVYLYSRSQYMTQIKKAD